MFFNLSAKVIPIKIVRKFKTFILGRIKTEWLKKQKSNLFLSFLLWIPYF